MSILASDMSEISGKNKNFATGLSFVFLLIPFASGILLAYPYRSTNLYNWLMVLCLLLFCWLLCNNLGYKKFKADRFKVLNRLLSLLLMFAAGALCCVLNDERLVADYYANKPASKLKISIIEEPRLKNGILSFKAEVLRAYGKNLNQVLSGKLLLSVRLDSLNPLQLKYGDVLIVPARSTEVSLPDNPAEFNYKTWLAAQNIYRQTFLSQKQVAKLERFAGNGLVAFALALRSRQINYYESLIKDKTASVLASTLILGYRANLDAETLAVYSKTGTIHVLSVSGMHVGLIYWLLNWLLFFLDRGKLLRMIKFLLIVTLIWGYTLLSGCSASVLRSAIMLSVFILAKTFSRNTNSYNIIAFAAFSLLLYDPYLVWDIGFQLSFLAVLGLIWLQPVIESCWRPKHGWLRKFWGTIAMSLAAQLITYPLSIYYFHQFPLYFLLSNLFILLPSAVLMYMGITILIFRLDFLMPAFEWMIVFMNTGLKRMSELPMASWSGIWIDKTELALIALGITAAVLSCSRRHKNHLFISMLSFLFLQLSYSKGTFRVMQQKKIIVFTIPRQHASAFISGEEAIIFTNLVQNDARFTRSVRPVLDSLQVKRIQLMKAVTDITAKHFYLKDKHFRFYNYRFQKSELQSPRKKGHKAITINIL